MIINQQEIPDPELTLAQALDRGLGFLGPLPPPSESRSGLLSESVGTRLCSTSRSRGASRWSHPAKPEQPGRYTQGS